MPVATLFLPNIPPETETGNELKIWERPAHLKIVSVDEIWSEMRTMPLAAVAGPNRRQDQIRISGMGETSLQVGPA